MINFKRIINFMNSPSKLLKRKKTILVGGIILFLIVLMFFVINNSEESLKTIIRQFIYHRPIHAQTAFNIAVAEADCVVIYHADTSYTPEHDVAKKVITITDPIELNEIRLNTKFGDITFNKEVFNHCMCFDGWYFDWQKHGKQITKTSLQHANSIRWVGFSSARLFGFQVGKNDAPLTEESQQWYKNWFFERGIELK